jgi:hypothetical protein
MSHFPVSKMEFGITLNKARAGHFPLQSPNAPHRERKVRGLMEKSLH